MNKKMIAFFSALYFSLSSTPIPANADSANPPVITGFTQLTQGPYKIGDMIQFKIDFTGGNPGLSKYWIEFDDNCIFSEGGSGRLRTWSKGLGENAYFGNGLLTGFINVCKPGIHKVNYIQIQDLTDLTSKRVYPRSFENNQDKFEILEHTLMDLQPGEVAPETLIQDEVDLSVVPKNPKIGYVYDLPKFSKIGKPIFYSLRGDQNPACTIFNDAMPQNSFFGGKLKITKAGKCEFVVEVTGSGFLRTKYATPKLISNGDKNNSLITYKVIGNSNTTISCIKGKLTKKVTGINPKCPSGYKLKS